MMNRNKIPSGITKQLEANAFLLWSDGDSNLFGNQLEEIAEGAFKDLEFVWFFL